MLKNFQILLLYYFIDGCFAAKLELGLRSGTEI